ncbi:MAG: ATP-binding protein [Chloroflexi bacterium]|nr:ATP-binding protein [Chloroflexota bacterium]
MNTEEAQRIISGGEGQTTEFKRSFAEENEIIKSLCAFAHADGGTVFIGVGDDLQIVGVTLGNNTLENFANNVRRSTNPPLSPALYQLNIEGRVIVVAVAQQAEENQVFYAFTLPYIRVGKTNQVMSPDEQRARLSRSDLGSSSPSMTRSDANEYAERREHFIRLNDRISNLDSQRINRYFPDGIQRFHKRTTLGLRKSMTTP